MTILKNFDLVLIGHSLSSYILGLDALDRNKTVLIVDDNQMDRLFSSFYLSGLEKIFLQKWGETRNIYPLVNLDDYLRVTNLNFYVDQTQIALGSLDVKRNLQELLRKLNISIADQSIDVLNEEFKLLVNEIVWHIVENQLSEKKVHELLQSKFSEINKLLEKIWARPKYWDTRKSFKIQSSFWFFYQEGEEDNYLQKFLLFINWCLPYYQIKNDKLFTDLKQTFFVKGGDIRDAQVLEWQYDGKKPWCLGLSSYEGVVHPKRVIWGKPRWLSQSDNYGEMYGTITNSKLKSALPMGISLFTQEINIGGATPLFILHKSATGVSYRLLIKRGIGSKETFFTAQVIEYLTMLFKDMFYVDLNLKPDDLSSFFSEHTFYTLLPSELKNTEEGNIFDLYQYQRGLGELESYVLAKDYLYDRRTFN
jgi:hypothetical protein